MTPGVRRTRRRSPDVVARQWDRVASDRDHQIRSGQDVSYTHVLVPTVYKLAAGCDWRRVLDVGCGSGALTERLASDAAEVHGVDLSRRSLAIADASPTRPGNARYTNASVEAFADQYSGRRFTLAVANMVLQDTPTLPSTVDAIGRLLTKGGALVGTITHPCFWPAYWGYADAPWFAYADEIAVEAPFRISSSRTALGVTTHYHRPLSRYLASLHAAGLSVEALLEPMPPRAVLRLYPRAWRYPRFLAFRCVLRA